VTGKISPMPSRRTGILCLISWLVFLWAGCGGDQRNPECPPGPPQDKPMAAGGTCRRDADCRTMFCDRNVCVDPFEKGKFGGECELHPPITAADGGLPDRGCGGHLCLEGRCRHCTSDEECEAHFGAARCSHTSEKCVPGLRKSQTQYPDPFVRRKR
jgi:hypothetical protein